MDKIEIPFGAYDSETLGWTYTIPKGYIAKIEDGKIVVKKEELEDEKIRKSLVKFLKSLPIKHRCEYAASELENWLAWLEKQKEQKPAEWGEEDYGWLNEAIMMIQNKDGWIRSDDAPKGVVNWLKTLPERINLQPKQEWSEEDEEMIKMILGDLEWERRNTTVNKDIRLYDEKIAWLKSLRPSWKPSEEQIQGLAHAINLDVYDAQRYKLDILYNDLKKLM